MMTYKEIVLTHGPVASVDYIGGDTVNYTLESGDVYRIEFSIRAGATDSGRVYERRVTCPDGRVFRDSSDFDIFCEGRTCADYVQWTADNWFEIEYLIEDGDPEDDGRQRFTSADTSINKDKLPAAYRADIPAGAVVLDYGCGKYTGHLKAEAARRGWTWYGFDPYNRTPEENRPALDAMRRGRVDYVICSNVLNVIDSDAAMWEVIDTAAAAARIAAIFTVYEGDRSSIGRQTGPDQYQRNEKRRVYVNRIQGGGYNVKTRKGCIIIEK